MLLLYKCQDKEVEQNDFEQLTKMKKNTNSGLVNCIRRFNIWATGG